MIVDLRSLQAPAGPDPKCGRIAKGSLVLRDPATIDTICLHQMAVTMGARTADVQLERGDKRRGRWRRALGVHAHVSTFIDNAVVPAYPLTAYVWHGNGANERSIGLEIEGLYNGRPGGSDSEPTDLTIATAREAVQWIVAAAASEGITIRRLVAHRQYSASRRADPGWRLWREVALWAESELELALDPTHAQDGGYPIPQSWDPRQSAPY